MTEKRDQPELHQPADASGAEAFLDEAYALSGDDSMQSFYQRWASRYDQQMIDGLGYESPQRLVDLFHAHCPAPGPVDVLDIGCGTGLLGQCLQDSLSSRDTDSLSIDGVDRSQAMLQQASLIGCYRQLLTADLMHGLPLADATYDAVLSCGTFTHGHVDATPVPDLVRVLRPGGLLLITVHEHLWEAAGFEAALALQTTEAQLKELSRERHAFFSDGPREGWFCCYRRSRY